MTSPLADRLRSAAAATGTDRPEMAMTLANSDLDSGDMELVGGFTRALDDAMLVKLTRAAGGRLELNSDQRSRLDATGEDYSDVADGEDEDSRNWLEKAVEGLANKVSNTGEFLLKNPGTEFVLDTFDFLGDVAKLPARMLSSGIDGNNDDEIAEQMQAKGYTPGNAWDYVQFMTMQGDSLYHDLDGLRDEYDGDMIDLAVEMEADPEGFAERLPKRDTKIQEIVNSDEFKKVADAVGRQHISPGRDIARTVMLGNVDNEVFEKLSGVLDAAYTLLLDPTLMVGRVAKGVRALDAMGDAIQPASKLARATGVPLLTKGADRLTGGRYRAGLRDAIDVDGIRALMTEKTAVGKRARQFIDDAKLLRETTDEAEKGAIYARMNARYKPWMPFLDEVNGTRVLANKYTDIESVRRTQQELLESKGISEALDTGEEVFPSQVEHFKVEPGQRLLVKDTDGVLTPGLPGKSEGATPRVVASVEHQQVKTPGTTKNGKPKTVTEDVWTYTLDDGAKVVIRRDAKKKTGNWPYVLPARSTEVPVVKAPEGPSFERKFIDANQQGWLATKAEPIETLEEFAEYMAGTAGFLRMANGAAAKRELYLPGRIALTARLNAMQAGNRARRGGIIFDHTKPYKQLADDAEEEAQAALDAGEQGDIVYNMLARGTADGTGWNPIRKSRAKWEQRARRVSSLAPTVARINLTGADGAEQLRRLARMYLPKAEADRLAGLYAVSDLGRRREIVMGAVEQTFHAAGLSRSKAGLDEMEKFRADQLGLNQRAYGLNRTDVIKTDAGERHVALLPSQLSDEVMIPDFKSLSYMASKFAVAEFLAKNPEGRRSIAGMIRAGFQGDGMDQLMHAIKLGWITSSAGGTRNALDEIAGVGLTGGTASMLHGRHLYSKVTQEGRTQSLAERKRARALEGKKLPSIPLALRGAANRISDVFAAEAIGKLWSFKAIADTTEDDIKYATEFAEQLQGGLVRESLTGTYFADDAMRTMGNDGMVDTASQGIMSAPVRFNGENVRHEFDGYRQVEIDGGVGLDGLANNLGQAFQDTTSPAHVALKGLTTEGADVLGEVMAYMKSPEMRHFRENAEMFKWTRDGKAVVTEADMEDAVARYSENLIAHVVQLVGGRGAQLAEADELAGAAARWENDIADAAYAGPGPMNADLVDMLQKGIIPDRAWLKENLASEEMPVAAIQKTWLPVNPQHLPGQVAQGYTSLLTKGYNKVVTDQVNALSRNPMMTAAYVQARHNIKPYEQHLIDVGGFSPEIAETMAKRMSLRQAEEMVIRMVDNPEQATQYAIIARNFHAFARAQEDWLRRWGRILKDDPTVIRKVQLGIHGAESAGLVEKNDEGDLIFTYPGSGLVLDAVNKVFSAVGLSERVQIPIMPNMTSQLMFLNPSLDNPIGFSAMPVVSIPFKAMAASLGADYPLIMASMDKVMNGELGAGRDWYEMMLPGFANRIMSGVISDEDPQSQFASAYTSALMNMSAAGRLDDLDLNDATAVARFQNDLKSQISNQMVARSIFGFFAPAAPSMPTNDVKTKDGEWVNKPDFVFEKMGLSSLKDQARFVFSTMPYEEALEYWTKNHPGELIYAQGEVARTTVGTEDAQAFATIDAAKWMQENPHLLENYGGDGGVAAYFIPQGTAGKTGGEFSQVAYRAQLEQGIREHKTLDEYFEAIVIQRGEAQYYDTKDDFDEAITSATASGDMESVRVLEEEWAQESQRLKGINPLMAQKFATFATSGVQRRQQLAQLNQMLADPDAVSSLGEQVAGVAELMLAEREFEAAKAEIAGKRGYRATTERAEIKRRYADAVAQVVEQFPGLGDLARGIFRVPN